MNAEMVCELITAAEREAAKLILEACSILAEEKTGQRDVVTEYDRKVQELLVERLGAEVEGARFFCEENDRQDAVDAEHLFVIDPIDGTMNFVRHFNHSCISVAYMSRGELLAAAVYNPYVDEMFTAVRGKGAFLNGKPIHVEDVPLCDTIACFGTSPYSPELADKTFALVKKVHLITLDIRRQGSAALDLCSAASGRAGVYFEENLSFWDYAAGMLIVEEAGGIVRTTEGKPLPLDGSKSSVVAGGKTAVEEVLALAKE